MSAAFLILNAGSSSLKFALYSAEDARAPAIARGTVEALGNGTRSSFRKSDSAEESRSDPKSSFTHEAALAQVLGWIGRDASIERLMGAGHRVVHGGGEFVAPVLVTSEVFKRLARYKPMAPLHQPYNLAAIEALAKSHPDLPQVACFDTAFHAPLQTLATTFALPRALTEKGVRRYGFHGLSYDYIAGVLPAYLGAKADARVVVAHLGHGASMCAMLGRKSVATTMGFSALDGLVMGTRSGSLDPGVLLYLLDEEHMSSSEIGRMLYHQSGLLGVSGVSDDMRDLLASERPEAKFAIELFVYRIARELGSLAAALGGLDALVFTAGIGAGSPEIRARVCAAAAWLGAEMDVAANARGGPIISMPSSKVALLALPTDEEAVIVRACRALLA